MVFKPDVALLNKVIYVVKLISTHVCIVLEIKMEKYFMYFKCNPNWG